MTNTDMKWTGAVSPASSAEQAAEVPEEADLNLGICPYYMRDRGKGIVYCECAKFRFPDKGSRREILYRFCAHPEGYKACMIKQALDHYYERKFARYEKEIS